MYFGCLYTWLKRRGYRGCEFTLAVWAFVSFLISRSEMHQKKIGNSKQNTMPVKRKSVNCTQIYVKLRLKKVGESKFDQKN